jgi:cytochrome c553
MAIHARGFRQASFMIGVLMALAPFASRGQDAPASSQPQACFACHGPEGNSGTPEVPSLAGQPREFLVAQIHLFRDGGRVDAQMAPQIAKLTDPDIEALAAYFATISPKPPERPADPTASAAAEPLLDSGKCAACHGEALAGQLQAPRLAGQQRAYLIWQLRAYRDGKRLGTDDAMRDAAKKLSNRDINVLADHISRISTP